MYSMISHSDTNNTHACRWAFIWDFKVPPKINTFIWKLCNNILPTRYFLHNRIQPKTYINPNCIHCNNVEKNLKHLFRDCNLANSCWNFIDCWWRILDINLIADDWLWEIFMAANNKTYKVQWQTTISAVLWSIWLHRKDKIFNNPNVPLDTLHYLVKLRSHNWCVNLGILHRDSERDWFDNPTNAIKTNYMHMINELASNWDYIEFTDGSWKIVAGNKISGIGGNIMVKDNHIRFIFSGPSTTQSPLQAETKALMIALKKLANHSPQLKKMIIYTDSSNLF